MMHPDHMYQLRQIRNSELLLEAQRARITQELVRNQRLLEYDKGGTTWMKLTIRYAGYILSTLRHRQVRTSPSLDTCVRK